MFPTDPPRRWEAEKWIDWQQTTLGEKLLTVFRGMVRTPPDKRDMVAIESARVETEKNWRRLDAHLGGRNYVAGPSFTMGDIPLGACAYRWYALDIERPVLPHLKSWYERLRSREAFRTHVMQPLT